MLDTAALSPELPGLRLLYLQREPFLKAPGLGVHFTRLVFISSGGGNLEVNGAVHTIQAGDLAILDSSLSPTCKADGKLPLRCIELGVQGADFLLQRGGQFLSLPMQEARAEVQFYLKELCDEYDRRADLRDALLHGLLCVLLVKCMRLSGLSAARRPSPGNRECANVKQYIDTHFAENLTLEALADLAHLNKYYLVHTFTREYGISPIQYLIQRRIEESRHYLESTDNSVSQIAQALGFSSSSYFSQSFRKQEGVSPREYRRHARGRASGAEP